jgi:hypothetical protein
MPRSAIDVKRAPRDPDPEVPAKARRFPAAYRLRILKQADPCKKAGDVGALLRREGPYSSPAWGCVACSTERRVGRTPPTYLSSDDDRLGSSSA